MSSDQRTEWLGSPEKQGAVWGVDHPDPHVGSEPFGTHESDDEVARERLRDLISAIGVASQGRARFAVHDHSEARCLAEIAYQRSWYEFASHLCKSFHRPDGTISDATAEKASLDRAIRIAEGLHPGFASRHVGTAMLAPEQEHDQSAEPASSTTKSKDPIGTQRVAKSPLQELEYRGENVALPRPKLSVGTVVCPKTEQAAVNSSYFLKKIRSQIEADTLEVVNVLRLKHPSFNMGEVGDPLPDFNAAQVDAKMAIVLAPDSVEIAGHAPRAMHAVGVIGNQCYLEDGQCHGGLKYDAYLLFRKNVDGNILVYVHPHAVVPEYCLLVAQAQVDNWWGVNEAVDCEQEREPEHLNRPVQRG